MQKVIQVLFVVFAWNALPLMASEKVDKQLDVASNAVVNIDNMRGEISITGWEKNIVSVKGRLDEQATGLVFERKGSLVELNVLLPKHKQKNGKMRWRGKGSDLEVFVPKTASIRFTGIATKVYIDNITNNVDINNVSGNIVAKNIDSRVNINSVSGDIESKKVTGKLNFSTVSGDITDENSNGRITFKTISGHIRTKSEASEVSAITVSGKLDLNLSNVDDINTRTVSGPTKVELALNDNANARLDSMSGTVELEFNDDINANFILNSTTGGRIVNKITNDKAVKAKYGPSAKLSFEHGNGSALVRVSTLSGKIKVSG